MDKALIKRLAMRFLRTFLAGATATMVTLAPFQGNDWSDVRMWLGSLVLAGFVGGISGILVAANKGYRDLRNK